MDEIAGVIVHIGMGPLTCDYPGSCSRRCRCHMCGRFAALPFRRDLLQNATQTLEGDIEVGVIREICSNQCCCKRTSRAHTFGTDLRIAETLAEVKQLKRSFRVDLASQLREKA